MEETARFAASQFELATVRLIEDDGSGSCLVILRHWIAEMIRNQPAGLLHERCAGLGASVVQGSLFRHKSISTMLPLAA